MDKDHLTVLDEITYEFLTLEGISNFISHLTGQVITSPWWDLSLSMLVKRATSAETWLCEICQHHGLLRQPILNYIKYTNLYIAC